VSTDCLCPQCGSATVSQATLRLGIVQAQDTSLGRVRVTFNEFDHMLSYWLPVVVPKTQNDKAYWLPDVGEQVVCLMDSHDEDGVVIGAIYSQVDTTPVQSGDKWHLGFKDGSTFEYDRAAHQLSLTFSDNAVIKYDAGAHALSLTFNDQATLKYDAAAHVVSIAPSDGTTIKYDATEHVFSFLGCAGATVAMNAPAGIALQSGGSYVNINPSGVTINPPLQ
jgi:phage baseplate assembly protein gpV